MRNRTTWRRTAWMVVAVVVVTVAWLGTILFRNAPSAYAQCGGPIRSGTPISSSLSLGASCNYTFDGASRDLVRIEMTKSSSTLDPYLELYNPSGRRIAFDDDSGGNSNSLIDNFTLPGPGRYTIRARSYDGNGYGGFTLKLTRPARRK